MGFIQNDHDPCVFNKIMDGHQITIAFHVDDLLITSVSDDNIDYVIESLRANFTEITVSRGNKHSFLGMNIEIGDKYLTVDMKNYISKVLEDVRGPVRHAFSPASSKLFDVRADSKLLDDDNKVYFHSMVARLLYLAKRMRLEILTAVSWLSSRVNAPTEEDLKKLNHIFGYRDNVIRYLRAGELSFLAYIDASFGIHHDRTSRTGVLAMLAGAAVGGWSSKQKLVSKSSTEAEVIGLSDGLTTILWMILWLEAQGHQVRPAVVYQDNQSSLALMKAGKKPNQKTKHLEIRYYFAHSRVNNGDIELKYMPTEDMVADLLTKPICGKQFSKLVDRIHGSNNA
jgi:hypothetical protein